MEIACRKVLIKFLFPFHSVSLWIFFCVFSSILFLLFICLLTRVSAYFSSGIDLTCSSARKITRIRSWLNNFFRSFSFAISWQLEKFRFFTKNWPHAESQKKMNYKTFCHQVGKISTMMNFTQGIMKEINFERKKVEKCCEKLFKMKMRQNEKVLQRMRGWESVTWQ